MLRKNSNSNQFTIRLMFSVLPTRSTIRSYKMKCRLLEQAVRDGLKIFVREFENDLVEFEALRLENGAYSLLRMAGETMTYATLNINKISDLWFTGDALCMSYRSQLVPSC